MKDLDINTYTATFEHLAAVAEWEANTKGTIACYRAGLREQVHRRILNQENMPNTMAEWKEAARKEVNRILHNASLDYKNKQLQTQGPYQSHQTNQPAATTNQTNGIVPMDVDATMFQTQFRKLTNDERKKYMTEG
jgi:hypothetical protein